MTRKWTLVSLCALLTYSAAAQSHGSTGNVVAFKTTIDNVKTVFGVAPPVATLHPGDTLSMVKMDNPLGGPFYIERAEPGDTLVVQFLDLTVDGDQGVGTYSPGFGALSTSSYTPMLNPDLPERIWYYPIDHATNTATFK